MQIRWIAGRDFLPEEIARDSDSVMVNQAFVDTFLGRNSPIGLVFESLRGKLAPAPLRRQIVGVVGTIHYNRPREPDRPTILHPAARRLRRGDPPERQRRFNVRLIHRVAAAANRIRRAHDEGPQ